MWTPPARQSSHIPALFLCNERVEDLPFTAVPIVTAVVVSRIHSHARTPAFLMDLFNRTELRQLAEAQSDVCISLYMPTYRNESDWSQNTTRLKNLLRDARNQLRDQDYREDLIDDILADARQLLDRPGFWRNNLGDGLALFVTPDTIQHFRLPLTFDELVVVEDRFHLKPMFPLIAANNRFYLLAFSQKDVRLYQGTHQSMNEIERAEIPADIVEALQQSEAPERQLQSDAQSRAAENGDRMDAADYGAGEGGDGNVSAEPKDELKQFFREVNESVEDYISGEEVPLLLAGVSEYLPLFRDVNTYTHLIEDEIGARNPESLDLDALHEKAWAIVEPVFQATEETELDRFEQLYYQDEDMASDNFHEIVPGCAYSRVDTLFVPIGEYRWGRFDATSNTVEVHEEQEPGDGDLLNYAAVTAYLNGARVHAMRPEKMPGGRSIAATFRYRADVSAQENG